MVTKRKRKYHSLEKLGLAFLICFSGVGTSLAQEQTEKSGPPVQILKLKWEKQIRLPRNFDPSIIPTDGAFNDPSRSTTTTAGGGSSATNSAPRSSAVSVFPPTPARLPVMYVYTLKIRNTGSRMIEGVAWDYAFLDASNGSEIARRQFLSYVRLPPTKTASLEGQMRTSHVRLIRASGSELSSSGKNKQPGFIERAIIQCVLFADDTVWRNPGARGGVCEFLKSERALMKGKNRSGQH